MFTKPMKMRSIDGSVVSVALLTGHAISIGPEAREIPPLFISEAVKTGRVTMVESGDESDIAKQEMVAAKSAAGDSRGQDPIKIEQIKTAIKKALEAGDESFLTAANIPDARKLDSMTGMKVSAAERDQAWAELQAEAEGGAE